MAESSLPSSSLSLDWIYGYRGNQCRNNLVYNKNGKLIYFVAGVGIVYDVADKRQKFFLGHNDDIISLALHPDEILIATGQVGKSPFICIWNSETVEISSILKDGHTNGVTCLAFSRDGGRLVSIGSDQSNTICLWDWKRGKIIATTGGHSDRIFDVQFCPNNGQYLMASCGIKHIKFWSHSGGNTLTSKKGVFGKVGEIQTIMSLAFSETNGGTPLVTFSSTMSGDIYVWNDNQLAKAIRKAHAGAIYSLANHETGFISGGKDGMLHLWDKDLQPIRTYDLVKALPIGHEGLIIRSLYSKGQKKILIGTVDSHIIEFKINAEHDENSFTILMEGHSEGELWALAVHGDFFATGSDDKTVRIWNLKANKAVSKTSMDHGIRSCSFNRNGSSLAVGMLNGSFAVLATSDLKVQKVIKDRQEVIHEIKYSPDGRYLAVGSNDNFVDIYDVSNDYKKVGICSGNSSYVTHLDWSSDGRYIMTNSGAVEKLIYQMPAGKRVTKTEEISSITWYTFTGVLGDEVKGIWAKYSDITDVNATDVNNDVIVTADDFGLVKLFRFPSYKKGANHKKYVGHSAHVSNCRFTSDKMSVISIGGADHAIFRWNFMPGDEVTSPLGNLEDRRVEPVGRRSMDGGMPGSSRSNRSGASDSARNALRQSMPNKLRYIGDSHSDYEYLSDASAAPIDSDVEKENEKNYARVLSKQEVLNIHKKGRRRSLKSKPKNNASDSSTAQLVVTNEKKGPPDSSLRLAYVHGYRGFDCRNNLFYLPSTPDAVVYHTAAVGIVMNRSSKSQKFYLGHMDDIVSLAVHPVKDIVASGEVGKNPSIHVWEADSLKTVSILKDHHQGGVCACDFSGDGKKLATVGLDDSHCIVVWNWRKGEKLASTRGHKDKIYMIKWNPHEIDSLVTVGNRNIQFWSQTGNGFTSKRGLFGKVATMEAVLSVAYGKNPKYCFSGGQSGLIHCWVETKLVRVVPSHEGPVFSIYTHDGNSFFTGGKDGVVIQWNSNFNEKLATIKVDLSKDSNSIVTLTKEIKNCVIRSVACNSSHAGILLVGTKESEVVEVDIRTGNCVVLAQGHGEGELWGLDVHPSKSFFATVSDDCFLRIWSLNNDNRLISAKNIGKPSRSVAFSHDGKLLAVGSRDGSFVVMETNTLSEKIKVHRRKENISDIKFSPDPGKYLAVGSHDNFVDIYNVASCQHVGVCRGSSSYITHLDWDSQGKLLMTNSGAKEVLFYEAPRGTQQVPTRGEVDRMTWHTWTGVLGPKCEGIWSPFTDITDINSTHLSKDGVLLVTGDDFGFVKLFDFPARGKHAKYKKYIGHSAHVTNVRWSHDNQSIISVGGGDTSILIWNHIKNSAVQSEMRSELEMGPSKDIRSSHEVRSSCESLSGSEVKTSRAMRSSRSIQDFESTNNKSSSNQCHVDSEESESDDEDIGTGGYDSDVQREVDIDYTSRFNLDPLRDKPQTTEQKTDAVDNNKARMDNIKQMCSRKVEKSTLCPPAKVILMAGLSKDHAISGLNLVTVLGYRGFDCRNNVQYLDDGLEIVYHTAGVVVVMDIKTGKQRFYLGHRDDIISLIINRNPKFKGLLATGEIGPKPTIHVWDSKSLTPSSILIGSITKGVGSLSFSCSGKLLLALGVDENHTLVVFNWQEGVQLATATGSTCRLFHVEYRPDSDSSFVSVGIGHIKFWNLAGSALIGKKGCISSYQKNNPLPKRPTFLSLAFGTNNVTYSGSIIGNIYVWKEGLLIRVITAAHDGPIFSMFTTLSDGLLVSGAKDRNRDGQVKLWDQEMKRSKSFKIPMIREAEFVIVKSVSRIRGRILIGTKDSRIMEINEKSGDVREVARYHGDGELWGLSSHPTLRKFVTSSDDGYLKEWSIDDSGLIASHYVGPSRAVHHSRTGDWMVVGLNNGSFMVLTCPDFKCLVKKRDRSSIVTVVKFSPSDDRIIVATQERFIDIYELVRVKGQEDVNLKRSYIINLQDCVAISVDCSKDGDKIRVGTDRMENKFYDLTTGMQIEWKPEMEFVSWTSVSGAEVQGAWPKDGSLDHVNCAVQSNDGRSLVTGDDFGLIHLFKFPCVTGEFLHYVGHSAHVTNVSFSHDDSHVISTGGDDSSVFVWQCI